MNVENKSFNESILIPKIPQFLIVFALLFVPGVYIVLLLSVAVNVAIGGGVMALIYYIFAELIHRVPVGVLFLIGVGILIGIFATLKAIFKSLWKKPNFETGILINLDKEPLLASFIEKLCNVIGTELPNSVILHSQDSFFVMQGKLDTYSGRTEGRILSISLPLLNILTLNEFRAILSHEFAHFTGRDTLYSSFVLPVYVATQTAMNEMEAIFYEAGEDKKEESKEGKGESAGWMSIPLIIPYMILSFYWKIFHKINMSISRLREKRADIIATLTCGSNSFSSGLKKVVVFGETFRIVSERDINKQLEKENVFINYYDIFRKTLTLPEMGDYINKRESYFLSKAEGVDASHPALKNRLDYIPKVDEQCNDNELAISLLNNVEEYEKILTEFYTLKLKFINDYIQQGKNKVEENK